ncbi:hypothetical protein MVEN_01179400 [Mycena venus]|uniref:DUF6534 domain-containing protein n=1 Tax=Mycena venus TaxID=2733690 RepID=A0A8H6Y5G0_9AGAR|nr:hypothetical protein MVEN_01179400 [Mycena venus]
MDLNTTLGALHIGVLVSYVLFGAATTQTHIYYSRFADDSNKLKTLVAFVWVCDAAHALCIGHTLYTYVITDYGLPERFAGPAPKSLPTAVLIAGVIESSVQGFFGSRIFTLSKSKKPIIPFLIWAAAVVRLVGCIVVFSTGLQMGSVADYERKWEWLFNAEWIVSVVNDLTITLTLMFLLMRERTSAQKRTAALVDKIIAWTIETGMLTSASGIVMLATFVTMRENYVWLALYVINSRLFSNTLLASLNSRATLRSMEFPFSMSAIGSPSNGMGVQITTITHIASDADPFPGQPEVDKWVSEDARTSSREA